MYARVCVSPCLCCPWCSVWRVAPPSSYPPPLRPPYSPPRAPTHSPHPRPQHQRAPSAAPSLPRRRVVNEGRVGDEDPVTTPTPTVESCCPEPRQSLRPVDITHVVRCLRTAAQRIHGAKWVAPRLVGTVMVQCADSHGVADGVLRGAELQFLAVCVDPSGSLAAHAEIWGPLLEGVFSSQRYLSL